MISFWNMLNFWTGYTIYCNLIWGSFCLINCEAVYKKLKLFQTRIYKYDLFKNWTYSLQYKFITKFNDSSILITIFSCDYFNLLLAMFEYQPSLSSMTNIALGGSTNQIAVFTSNYSLITFCLPPVSYVIHVFYIKV